MANNIKFAKNYTSILNEVYQRAAVSRCLNSGGRMVRAGRNAKEILIPKISVTGLGDYTRNVGYKTGSITYEYETHSFGYDRAICPADCSTSSKIHHACFAKNVSVVLRPRVVSSRGRDAGMCGEDGQSEAGGSSNGGLVFIFFGPNLS